MSHSRSSNPEFVHPGDESEFNRPPRKEAQQAAVRRLMNDYNMIKQDPTPYIFAEPDPANILIWHYCLIGPPDTPYSEGIFHGKLRFPPDYPFGPPSIYMITPNGRFEVKKRLCLTISDYEPTKWSPAWNVGTILSGILSFMLEETPTWGSMTTSSTLRETLAKSSGQFNLKDAQFCELFPDIAELIRQGKVPKFEPVEKKKAPDIGEDESDYESVYDASSDSDDEFCDTIESIDDDSAE